VIEKAFGQRLRECRRLKQPMDYGRRDGDFLGAVFSPFLAVDLIAGEPVGGDTCNWQPENGGEEQERRQPGC
jgi:hypothetical protein